MRGWCAGVAVFLSAGCLDPMVSDQPGYSRHLLKAGTRVPSSADDLEVDLRIDKNDGVKAGRVAPRSGFADGKEVRYWDLGPAKSSIAPVYVLARCDAEGNPREDEPVEHPWIIESAPGDADYTPFRSLNYACITDAYAGELIPSAEALSDAIDMRLVLEPQAPRWWVNAPVVSAAVEAVTSADEVVERPTAHYRNMQVTYLSFGAHEGRLEFADRRVKAQNVYELKRQGEERVAQVVFAQAMLDDAGALNPRYAPAWRVVNVVLAAEADLTVFTRERDLVTIDDEGELHPASELVVSVESTSDLVNRPHERSGSAS